MTDHHQSKNQPPSGAPEGTVWFGGPIDESTISLRIFGEDLDPSEISSLLGSDPSESARTGQPVIRPNGKAFPARKGFWFLSLTKTSDEIEDRVDKLLSKLTGNIEIWQQLTNRYSVDIFCGLFMESQNRGFSLSPSLMNKLADRGISIGFDIYAPD